ncbi:MAG: beta-galactosidase [Clostridia bacterium]|nr:beta-galactosidase [Clostridia bacterium]
MSCCSIPRPEHPRPQFVRDSWVNLNGCWEFAFDHGDSGEPRGMYKADAVFPEKINVPFCPESKLSGIEYKDFMRAVWYRRTVNLTDEQCAGRIFLRFGAVDNRATVYVNGEKAGTHVGGYVGFGVEITNFAHPGENLIVVQAQDDNRRAGQPRGKQSSEYFSHGCDYTRTTGIWQTVWMEFVPQSFLRGVKIFPDARNANVAFRADLCGCPCGVELTAEISYQGKLVGSTKVALSGGVTPFGCSVSEVHEWMPGDPALYDVTYTLTKNGAVIDTVTSYFGFRRIDIVGKKVLINGKSVFQRLVLDQGFYPDGIYTAPTDDDLRGDIELSMAAGFNGARLHQKVFEERFLYWADKLGYLVWGEHASWGTQMVGNEAVLSFLPEWLEIVQRDINHPAIIGWCPYNETGVPQDNRVLELTYQATKALDPTRPCIDTSGYIHAVTDIYDVHNYDQNPETFAANYAKLSENEVINPYNPVRHHAAQYEGQPFFVSEYGGTWWAPGRTDGWGYGNAPKTEQELADRYTALTTALLDNPDICAFCYTQLTDIEQEQNGIYAYDRIRKFADAIYEQIKAANMKPAAIEKE